MCKIRQVVCSYKWFYLQLYLYLLQAMGYRPPKWVAMMITSTQLSYMFVGSFLTITPLNITIAIIMCIRYAILFARYFLQTYLSNKSVKNVGKKTDANSKLKASWNAYSFWTFFIQNVCLHNLLRFRRIVFDWTIKPSSVYKMSAEPNVAYI